MKRRSSDREIAREGWVFSFVLDASRLRLRMFGVFTIARIWLNRVRYIRQRGGGELARLFFDSFTHPFRAWYWPRPGLSRNVHRSTALVVRMQSGRRVYVRLRPDFYHRLRTAIGASRLAGSVPDDRHALQEG